MATPIRVLVVEDSEDDAELLLRELRRGGYEVTSERVDTPEATRAALGEQEWNLMTADHNMPHFDALGALKVLQESGLDLPFIVISGTIGEETAVAIMKAGAHDYIMKDNLARLVPAVERELREVKIRREKKWTEEAERQKTRDLEFLARTALEFAAFPREGDVYEHMAQCLTEIVGDSIVLVSSYDATSNTVEIRSVVGLGKLASAVLKLLGKDLVGMRFAIMEDMEPMLKRGELIKLSGPMHELAQGRLSQKALKAAAKLLGIGDVYSLGIAREGQLFASVTILAPPGAEFENKATFAAFANQASIALQRRLAEDALRESEKRFRTLVEHLPAITYTAALDESSTTLYVSPQIEKVLGISPAEYQTDADFWAKHLHDEDRERVLEEIGRAHESGEPFVSEYRMIATDGRVVWLRDEAVIVRDGEGTPLYLLGVMLDITERKRAEEQIRHLNAVLRAVRDVNQLITKEHDRGRLLKGACDVFVETRGCFNAWIAFLDEHERAGFTAEAGLGERFEPLDRRLRRGELPDCTRRTLAQPGVTVVRDPLSSCGDCPLAGGYEGKAGMSVRMEHEGTVYGILSLSIPEEFASDEEEQTLFHEVAGDIAFALHGIEAEEERKRAEKALRKSEERLRAYMDAAPDSFFLFDSEMNLAMLNDAALRMHPPETKREDVVGRHITRLVPNVRESDRYDQFLEVMRTGTPLVIDDVVTHPKFGSLHLEVRAFRALDGLGVITRDVTERKRAEEALREAEERYRDLTENLNDLVQSVAPNGSFVYVNRAWRETLGYSKEEIRGSSLWDVIHPDSQAHCREIFGRVIAGENVEHIEAKFVTKDGRTIEVEGSANCRIVDGKPVATRGIFRDVTQHRLAEKARRESEERYRDLVEATDELVQSVAPDGSIIYVNRAWRETLGYGEDEIPGLSLLDIIHPESREHCMEVFKRVLGGENVEDVEAQFVTKDGRTVIVEGSASCRFVNGKPVATYGIFHDVTEHRQLEDQLRQAQKMEAVGRLAGGIAHDFNNLLTVIIGQSALMLNQQDKVAPFRKGLEETTRAAERAAALTSQLLAFSRKQVLRSVVLDLNSVVRETERMLRRLIGEDIELITILEPRLGRIKGDRSHLVQVIMNLCVNARDAMPDGGKLTVETANAVLDEEYVARHVDVVPGHYVMLSVTDTGCGMDEGTLSQVFDPFFTTKPEGEGTGLGLSTVYGIVRQSGGSISIHSEPGQGTAFKIYFPRVDEKVERQEEREEPEELAECTETILVVEDQQDVREVTVELLASCGYRVLAAGDGSEALRIFHDAQEPFDLLLTDLVMPGMSGRDLSERLTQLRSGLKVLYMSGYTGDTLAHHGALDPGAHFILKPFSLQALMQKVREVLDAEA